MYKLDLKGFKSIFIRSLGLKASRDFKVLTFETRKIKTTFKSNTYKIRIDIFGISSWPLSPSTNNTIHFSVLLGDRLKINNMEIPILK